ncbi:MULTISPECIES: DUF6492 family protein [unclassified Paenibacillus]|uniref:DUF6492 family protein n=1 Tax=unclassified Paenibacillus TaxID=185978 RepID=UPI002404D835|nr:MULTISPECIES: DUF6492 family protein [unclassified Paenibacillus]MDF9844345.1 hypothetical protein [Paenibacillus sp. PastF-2]MDF9850949.1 hypothetical protein [Paenibacillus sp. PastM-2]MDF9857520.1 hypothetical protein [Paenibacillus sp. PastF-1]MDH6482839.1 hypothetical protein [Paenibacillus sp. PastH-2]MDH6510264.1 hypothetical protein [Paenibacillus sp. PastM-3]
MSVFSAGSAVSGPAIDVLIPAIDKDLATLPFVIDSLRRHVRHPISHIFIVSPASSRIRELCTRKSCIFVDETTVLPFTKQDIHYSSSRWNRSGWLYQQLLKMNGDRICREPFFLVIDADTVLIRPHRFRSGGKTVFYCRNWSQPEYFRTYRKLLGTAAPSPRSFVTHYMLFEKKKLSALKRTIEARQGLTWHAAIIRSINKKKQFGFSEFETYANYVYSKNRSAVLLRNANNKSLHSPAGSLGEKQIRKLARTYRSLSFHQRKGDSIPGKH